MDGSTWILIAAIALLVIGFVLTILFGEKALNKAYHPGSDHGLFYGGVILIGGGIGFLVIYIVMKIRKLNSEKNSLIKTNSILTAQLEKCGVTSSGSSGPGFFSRLGSKIGGFFSRNTSVPAAGNPGEVNPFKNQ